MLVSNAFRFIYVHVPKAASTTVRALLWEREGIDDLVYSHLDKYQRETFLTFAFVRDPLRRFISAYDEVCLKLGPTCRFYDAAGPGGLRAFLSYTRAHPCWDEHVCDQMSFLTAGDGRMVGACCAACMWCPVRYAAPVSRVLVEHAERLRARVAKRHSRTQDPHKICAWAASASHTRVYTDVERVGVQMRFDVLASTAELAPTLMHVSSVLGFDPPLSVESVAQPRNVGSRT